MNHKEWLDQEYSAWILALNSCTVDNFKSHPQVIRMLGQVDPALYPSIMSTKMPLLKAIDQVGGSIPGQLERFYYYAKMVIAQKPLSIAEIGGGCGQLYATLRALGYKGTYYIYDLPEVQEFQKKYLTKVQQITRLDLFTGYGVQSFDFCLSLYALGEFDDTTKANYINHVVKKCRHGLVVWNPHSGASDQIGWTCKVEPENPPTAKNNKLLTW